MGLTLGGGSCSGRGRSRFPASADGRQLIVQLIKRFQTAKIFSFFLLIVDGKSATPPYFLSIVLYSPLHGILSYFDYMITFTFE